MPVALAVVLAAYGVAGLSLRTVGGQLRPLLWIGLVTAGFHVVVNGWERAVVVVGVLAVLVLLAALVTLTTRTTELVDAVVFALPAAAGAARRPRADRPADRAGHPLRARGRRAWPRASGTRSGPAASPPARGRSRSR